VSRPGERSARTGPDPAARQLGSRIAAGTKDPGNWLQLVRFGLVGSSGYVVNLLVFAFCDQVLELHHFAGATIAFAVSVTNNFTWNRAWTFRASASGRRLDSQGARFLIVSLVGLAVNLVVLGLLVDVAGLAEIPSQAIAVVTALPVNFLGNKLWTFSTLSR